MNKHNEEVQEVGRFEMVATNAIKAVKVTAIVAVIAFTVLGVYVTANTDLRNNVIDHAQGQNTVAGLE